jgi:hypothetical protein
MKYFGPKSVFFPLLHGYFYETRNYCHVPTNNLNFSHYHYSPVQVYFSSYFPYSTSAYIMLKFVKSL